MSTLIIIACISGIFLVMAGIFYYQLQSFKSLFENRIDSLQQHFEKELLANHNQSIQTQLEQQNKHSNQLLSTIQATIHQQMQDVREQISHSFKYHADSLTKHMASLNSEVKTNLQRVSNEVNKQLNEGFEKTTTTFTQVVKRLAIIDEAQKQISQLSNHVIDLQSIFQDKRARGALGEVQLAQLIENVIPNEHFSMQHTLSNQTRVDCALFLPEPTGIVAIDAKFPLESFQSMLQAESEHEQRKAKSQFKQDIKKHIMDISNKYIIANETADGAIMFIPAESIFSEIHANFPELVSLSHQQKVWLTSPNTLMAILTTARAVIKDDATKKQVHLVQQHLNLLSKDFERFEKRMMNLSRHIGQANQDVSEINTSAKKISQRFQKIEQLELEQSEGHETKELITEEGI